MKNADSMHSPGHTTEQEREQTPLLGDSSSAGTSRGLLAQLCRLLCGLRLAPSLSGPHSSQPRAASPVLETQVF